MLHIVILWFFENNWYKTVIGYFKPDSLKIIVLIYTISMDNSTQIF